MIKLLLHESKRRVGSPGVFITPGTYFIRAYAYIHKCACFICNLLLRFAVVVGLPSARKGKWILELLRMLSIHHLDSKDQNLLSGSIHK